MKAPYLLVSNPGLKVKSGFETSKIENEKKKKNGFCNQIRHLFQSQLFRLLMAILNFLYQIVPDFAVTVKSADFWGGGDGSHRRVVGGCR